MNLWLLRLPFRHLHEHPGRSLLGIFSIALGTAVYLSIALASSSAFKSFQTGVAAVAGKARTLANVCHAELLCGGSPGPPHAAPTCHPEALAKDLLYPARGPHLSS